MTRQEALAFLSANENDDLISLYEGQIFEFKQDFTSKVLIPSVLHKKIEKLQKIDLSAQVLGIDIKNESVSGDYRRVFSSDILQSYVDFEKVYSQFKLEVYKSQYANELISYLQDFLLLFKEYLQHWPSFEQFEKTVILAKQADPMDLLSDIKLARENGITTFAELAGDLTENYPLLKKESTRLKKLYNMSL